MIIIIILIIIAFIIRCKFFFLFIGREHTTANERTPQLPPTLLAQQCWELLRPFACSFRVLILRMTAIQFLQYRIKGPGRCQAENRQGFSGYSLDLLVPLRSEI